MAYDQSKLIKDVRMYLGGVSEEALPESVIIYWGDIHDANPDYTGNYPYILWKTTLCCIQYLRANASTSVSTHSTKSSTKEKVGDVQIDISDDYASTEDVIKAYDDLYDYYLAHPAKFGISTDGKGAVYIGGVDQAEVDVNRSNKELTSIYNALPVTAFPKQEINPYRRTRNYHTARRRPY